MLAGIGIAFASTNFDFSQRAFSALSGQEDGAIGSVIAGKLRDFAVTTAKRSNVLPEAPTVAESGVPGYELTSWQGIMAPAKLTPPVARRLNQAVIDTRNAPEVRERLRAQSYDSTPTSLEETSRFVNNELTRYARLVKAVGVRPD
jgi:tripartite-type tricarboxylate transporter receptor subunit TctC